MQGTFQKAERVTASTTMHTALLTWRLITSTQTPRNFFGERPRGEKRGSKIQGNVALKELGGVNSLLSHYKAVSHRHISVLTLLDLPSDVNTILF